MTDIEWLARNVHEWPMFGDKIEGLKIANWNGVDGHVRRVCGEFYYTKDQWLAERARIQNKPKEWEGEWLFQDKYGWWHSFDDSEEPIYKSIGDAENYCTSKGISKIYSQGEVLGDWRDTLERRPDADTAPELDYGTNRAHNTTTPAPDFLSRALGHMQDRASTYDNEEGERSMASTVGAFNAIAGRDLAEEEGWLFMIMLKCARTQQGEFKSDNYEDGAAYFGLMGESASRDRD